MGRKQKTGVCEGKIDRCYLKGWPKQSTEVLLNATSVEGVRWRVIDGSHVMLMVDPTGAPHGETLKVSRSRTPEQTLDYVERLLRENGLQ